MIKLLNLLLEAIKGKPKAIFLGGSPGAGKSTLFKKIIPSSFTSINVDDTYEELLTKAGLSLKQKDYGAEQNALAGKLMAQARTATVDKYTEKIKGKNNIVIDSLAASPGPVQKKKEELEALGYDCMMVMIFVSPLTSLERNNQRDRSLMPSIVIKSWHAVNTAIDTYKKMFGDKFIIVNNDPNGDYSFSKEKIEPFIKDSNPNAGSKIKTPEEIAKQKADKEKMYNEIGILLKKSHNFDDLTTATAKINKFTNEA